MLEQEIKIRTFQPGEPSLVCYFQTKLYDEQFHFNVLYEKEMLTGMSEIYDDRTGNQMWIAERDGQIVGDIAIIKRGEHEAQLRWFGVAMSLQGNGLGQRLVQTAMNFCRENGLTHIYLGTLNILKPARHIYAKNGFHLVSSEPFSDWADNWEMFHEMWECDLAEQ